MFFCQDWVAGGIFFWLPRCQILRALVLFMTPHWHSDITETQKDMRDGEMKGGERGL